MLIGQASRIIFETELKDRMVDGNPAKYRSGNYPMCQEPTRTAERTHRLVMSRKTHRLIINLRTVRRSHSWPPELLKLLKLLNWDEDSSPRYSSTLTPREGLFASLLPGGAFNPGSPPVSFCWTVKTVQNCLFRSFRQKLLKLFFSAVREASEPLFNCSGGLGASFLLSGRSREPLFCCSGGPGSLSLTVREASGASL